jgi:hypothetical protein
LDRLPGASALGVLRDEPVRTLIDTIDTAAGLTLVVIGRDMIS